MRLVLFARSVCVVRVCWCLIVYVVVYVRVACLLLLGLIVICAVLCL